MYSPPGVRLSADHPIPETMKAWVLGDPGELSLTEKPVRDSPKTTGPNDSG